MSIACCMAHSLSQRTITLVKQIQTIPHRNESDINTGDRTLPEESIPFSKYIGRWLV